MNKIIYLTESDLYRISKRVIKEREEQELEQELDEIIRFNLPVGTKLGNIYQGIKGFVKGESYGYFNYLSKIKNRSKRVMNELEHIETFVKYLTDLKPKIEKLKIAPEKKLRLLNLLDTAINKWQPFFPQFSDSIKEINKLSHEKLSGERLDVIPGSDVNQLGSDLMKSKDIESKPELVNFNQTTEPSNTEKKNELKVKTPKEKISSTYSMGDKNKTPISNLGINKTNKGQSLLDLGLDDDTKEKDIKNPLTTQGSIETKSTSPSQDARRNMSGADPSKNSWSSENKPKDDIGIDDEDLTDEEKMLLGKTVKEEVERFRQIIRY